MEQKDVVAVDHRRVGGFAVKLPNGTVIEGGQAGKARVHVGEAAQPDEAIGPVEVAEGADHLHPERFLRLDEVVLEEVDQGITLAVMQRVLPEFDDRISCRVHGQPREAAAPASAEPPFEIVSRSNPTLLCFVNAINKQVVRFVSMV